MDEYEFRLKHQRGETINLAVSRLCKWVPITVISYFVYLAVAQMSGKVTSAQFGLALFADLKANTVLSHLVTGIFGVGGVVYGYKERKLRQKNIQRTGNSIQELESIIDPKRSSSRLTNKGATRPEDKV